MPLSLPLRGLLLRLVCPNLSHNRHAKGVFPYQGELLHSLMYVGGTVVMKPPLEVDPAYVLVGIEI